MSLADQIFASQGVPVLLDVSADDIQFFPEGVTGKVQNIKALVDRSSLAGTNEHAGDGTTLNRATGSSKRISLTIQIDASLPVKDKVSLFKIDGDTYTAKRDLGTDASLTTWRIVRVVDRLVKQAERKS